MNMKKVILFLSTTLFLTGCVDDPSFGTRINNDRSTSNLTDECSTLLVHSMSLDSIFSTADGKKVPVMGSAKVRGVDEDIHIRFSSPDSVEFYRVKPNGDEEVIGKKKKCS